MRYFVVVFCIFVSSSASGSYVKQSQIPSFLKEQRDRTIDYREIDPLYYMKPTVFFETIFDPSLEIQQLKKQKPEQIPPISLKTLAYHSDPKGRFPALSRDKLSDIKIALPSVRDIYFPEDKWDDVMHFKQNPYRFDALPRVTFSERLAIRLARTSFVIPWPDKETVWQYKLLASIENAVLHKTDKKVLAQILAFIDGQEITPDGFYYYLEFICYLAQRDIINARNSLQKLVDIRLKNGKSVSWWNYLYLGRLYLMSNNLNMALEYFDKTLQRSHKTIVAYIYKARALERMERYDDALEVYRDALKKAINKNTKMRVIFLLAGLHVQLEQWIDIVKLIRPYIDDKKLMVPLVRYYCEALMQLNRNTLVERTLKIRMGHEPDNMLLVFLLAQFYWNTDRQDEALQLLTDTYYSDTSKLSIGLRLALYYTKSGDIDEAIAILERATQAHPRFVSGITRLGELYFMRGDYDKAIELYKNVLEQNPHIHIIYFLLGKTYKTLKEYEKMQEICQLYLVRFPKGRMRKAVKGIMNRPDKNKMERKDKTGLEG